MGNRLPRITAKEIIKILKKKGFYLSRQSGSHKIYRNDKGKIVTVPYHAGTILKPKTFKRILKQADISIDELL